VTVRRRRVGDSRSVHLATAVASAVLVLSAGCDGKGGDLVKFTPPPRPSSLLLVVNPSKNSHALAFRHARTILRAVARPRMVLIGLYEQKTTDDGKPFDRPFAEATGPWRPPPSPLRARHFCKESTRFRTERCKKRFARWQRALNDDVRSWSDAESDALSRIERDGRTEEAPYGVWNLSEVLLRAGVSLAAAHTPIRCIVLLGGLAVRQPPPQLVVGQLRKTTLIAAGWRGTPSVQEAWMKALAPAGASIVFVPQAVTDIKLVEAVDRCLDGRPAENGTQPSSVTTR
jgi:hypothetical protein